MYDSSPVPHHPRRATYPSPTPIRLAAPRHLFSLFFSFFLFSLFPTFLSSSVTLAFTLTARRKVLAQFITRNLVKPERNLVCRFPRGLDHSAGHPPPSMFEFISFPQPVFPSFASPCGDGRSVGLLFKVFIRPVIEKVMVMVGILGWVNLWKLIRRAESVRRRKRVL